MLLRGEFRPNIIFKKVRNSTAKKAQRLCRGETNSTAMMWNGRCLNKPHIWARTGQTLSTAVLLNINTVLVHQLYVSLFFSSCVTCYFHINLCWSRASVVYIISLVIVTFAFFFHILCWWLSLPNSKCFSFIIIIHYILKHISLSEVSIYFLVISRILRGNYKLFVLNCVLI